MHWPSPNTITIARILAVPVVVIALTIAESIPLAFVVFTIAAATDGLDGYLARSRNRITVLGTFLDPLADKLLMTAALVSLVQLQRVDAWIVILILTREFAVTGLRLMAISKGEVVAANWLGKLKTAAQIVAVMALIPKDTDGIWVDAALTVAVAATVVSGVWYFWQHRDYLRETGPA